MAISSKFFKDHFILLMTTVNLFLCIIAIVFIIVRLSSVHSTNYIIQCRNCSDPNAVNKFITGSVVDMVSFIVFSVVVLVSSGTLSYRVFLINRKLSIAILGMGIILQVLTLIITNALFILR
jgi:hypothetical protein